MADDEIVKSETQKEPVRLRPALVLGHDEKGEFKIAYADPNLQPLRALHLLLTAAESVRIQINPHRAPESVIATTGPVPPEVADAMKNGRGIIH